MRPDKELGRGSFTKKLHYLSGPIIECSGEKGYHIHDKYILDLPNADSWAGIIPN